MTDKTNSQVQNPFESFKAINAQQIQAMEKLFAEIDKLETRAVEQTNTMVTQLATMARESVNASTRVVAAQQSAVAAMTPSAIPGASAVVDQTNKLRDSSIDQARVSVDELARLSQASISYATRMSAEWRKLTLETARRSVEWMNPGV
jgi:hypothetical protein